MCLALEVEIENHGTIVFFKRSNIAVFHALDLKFETSFSKGGRVSHARNNYACHRTSTKRRNFERQRQIQVRVKTGV